MKKLIIVLLAGFFSICSVAQTVAKEIYYRVYFEADQEKFKELNQFIIFEHLARSGNGYTGEFNTSEKDILLTHATHAKVLISDMSAYYKQRAADDLKKNKKTRAGGVPLHFHGGSMGGFMTLAEAISNLDSMVLLYPNIVTPKQTIGTTLEGRPIYLYKISDNPSQSEPQEHKVLYTALHHAREPESLAQLVYYMWYLLENYNSSDSVVTHLVDDRELFFIPVLNPDGYFYNETTDPWGGGMWRKNRQVNAGGTFGVDLNRNYAFQWAYDNTGSSPSGSSDTYRGATAFSELETQAVKNLCLANKYNLIMNYHSYGDWLIYPFGYINQITPDDITYNELANHFTVDNAYVFGTCFQTLAYYSNGCSDDWHYGEQTLKPKMFAFTPEVGSSMDGFWPMPSQIIPLAQENLTQNILSSWMAGPYIERARNLPYEYTTATVALNYNYINYGIDTCLNIRSWFTSASPYFVSSDTFNTNNILSQQNSNGAIHVTVSTSTPYNTIVSGRVYTKYNNFIFSDTASFRIKTATAISEMTENGITISPNPTNGLLLIQSDASFNDISIEIKDISGRTMLRKEHIVGHQFDIDISKQAKGIYLLELSEGNKTMRMKVVKD